MQPVVPALWTVRAMRAALALVALGWLMPVRTVASCGDYVTLPHRGAPTVPPAFGADSGMPVERPALNGAHAGFPCPAGAASNAVSVSPRSIGWAVRGTMVLRRPRSTRAAGDERALGAGPVGCRVQRRSARGRRSRKCGHASRRAPCASRCHRLSSAASELIAFHRRTAVASDGLSARAVLPAHAHCARVAPAGKPLLTDGNHSFFH